MLMKTVWGAGRKCQLLEKTPGKKEHVYCYWEYALFCIKTLEESLLKELPVFLAVLCCFQEEDENFLSSNPIRSHNKLLCLNIAIISRATDCDVKFSTLTSFQVQREVSIVKFFRQVITK